MIQKYVKTFFFEGKSGELYFAHVYKTHLGFHICACNLEKVQIGEVSLSFFSEELSFIYNLHVYKERRNDYIGSHMIEIIEELMKNWKYKNIYGDFEPSEPFLEEFDKKILEKQVMSFYRKNFF